jgi:hypothetical protein
MLRIYSTDDPSWVAQKLKSGFVLQMKRYILSAPIAESRCYALSMYKKMLHICEPKSRDIFCRRTLWNMFQNGREVSQWNLKNCCMAMRRGWFAHNGQGFKQLGIYFRPPGNCR